MTRDDRDPLRSARPDDEFRASLVRVVEQAAAARRLAEFDLTATLLAAYGCHVTVRELVAASGLSREAVYARLRAGADGRPNYSRST